MTQETIFYEPPFPPQGQNNAQSHTTSPSPQGFGGFPSPSQPQVAPSAQAQAGNPLVNYTNTDSLSNELVIFAGIYCGNDELFRTRRAKFTTTFPNTKDMFFNEWAVFAILLQEYPRIMPKEKFISIFMRSNQAKLRNLSQIDYTSYRLGDNDPYAEFTAVIINTVKSFETVNVSESDFEMAIEMYKMEYLNRESLSVLEEAAAVLSEGITRGNKATAGYEDMRKTLNTKFAYLDNVNAKSSRRGVITYGADSEDETGNSGKLKLVSKFGIEALDTHVGGIYQGDMVSLLAPAKGCKTRSITFMLHHALVTGTSFAMWSVENGPKGFEALLRARHFNWLYNRNVETAHKKIFLDSDMIRKGELTGEVEKMELASWLDLKTNKSYGRFAVIDENFLLESFLESITLAVDTIGAQLISVDYLQLIQSKNGMPKNERISAAYIQMLQYLKEKKLGGLFPGQLKQSFVGELSEKTADEMVDLEMRDAAGESYEVIKTPDVNLALYGSVADIRRGSMKLLSVPSRNIAPFKPIDLYVEAGTCTFKSINQEADKLPVTDIVPEGHNAPPAAPQAPTIVSSAPATLGGVAPQTTSVAGQAAAHNEYAERDTHDHDDYYPDEEEEGSFPDEEDDDLEQ